MKWFPVDSNQWSCHGNAFVEQRFAKISTVLIVTISDLWVQIRNQSPKPTCKFQPNWTKYKGSQISTSNDNEKCLITSYTRDSDDVIKIFNDFGRFCARVPSCQV